LTLRCTRTEIRLDLAPELPSVQADPEPAQQVDHNLVNNACRPWWIPPGRPLQISTRASTAWCVLAVERRAGRAAELVNKIFELFSRPRKSDGQPGWGFPLRTASWRARRADFYETSPLGGRALCWSFRRPAPRPARRRAHTRW